MMKSFSKFYPKTKTLNG